VILDVGGAEGAYALPLAASGYTVMRAIRRVESEPSLLGASPHLTAIATKTR
jgi:hypothetical protein